METEINKTPILESFIKYTVLFYLAIIIHGYLCVVCYYNFFGVSAMTYFTIDDYIHEIFTSWMFLLVSAGTYFFFVVYFRYMERFLIGTQDVSRKLSLLDSKRFTKYLIISVFLFAVISLGLLTTYIIVTERKNLTFYLFYGVPIFFIALLFLSLSYLINFRSLKITRTTMFILTFIIGVFLFNMAKYIDIGYTTLNSKSTDLKRSFHFNTGAIITTSDTVLYLGSSKDYVFMFDKLHKKAFIYNRSTILYTEVNKKKFALTK
jgi:hypothetical protein